jgi:phage baseplate assembly protein W
VQRDQTVSQMAEEILLARQAMALLQRSEEPLIDSLEDILKTPAGSQPLEPMGGPEQEE